MKNNKRKYSIADLAKLVAQAENEGNPNVRNAKKFLMGLNDMKRGSKGSKTKARLGLDMDEDESTPLLNNRWQTVSDEYLSTFPEKGLPPMNGINSSEYMNTLSNEVANYRQQLDAKDKRLTDLSQQQINDYNNSIINRKRSGKWNIPKQTMGESGLTTDVSPQQIIDKFGVDKLNEIGITNLDNWDKKNTDVLTKYMYANPDKYKVLKQDGIFGLDHLNSFESSNKTLSHKNFNSSKKITPTPAPKLRDNIGDEPYTSRGIARGRLNNKSKQKNNPNLATGIFQGAAMLGDFANQMLAIGDTEAPSKAAIIPRARLNKNMDTSSYDNAAARALRTQNMIAGNNPNQAVGSAMRGSILGDYLKGRGEINTASNNYRSQMENREAQMNASINAQNAGIMNNLYSAQNQFANNKRMAKANAMSGLLGNTQLMAQDYRQMGFDRNVKYPALSKMYGSPQSNKFVDDAVPQTNFWGR